MSVRLLHISDLHAGSVEETAVEHSLERLIARVTPELIAVTGDLQGMSVASDGAGAFVLVATDQISDVYAWRRRPNPRPRTRELKSARSCASR